MPVQELQRRREEEEKLKGGNPSLALEGPPAAAPQPDVRSLDDLLSFIDGAGGSAGKGAKKKRGKGAKKQPVAAAATNGHQVCATSCFVVMISVLVVSLLHTLACGGEFYIKPFRQVL